MTIIQDEDHAIHFIGDGGHTCIDVRRYRDSPSVADPAKFRLVLETPAGREATLAAVESREIAVDVLDQLFALLHEDSTGPRHQTLFASIAVIVEAVREQKRSDDASSGV